MSDSSTSSAGAGKLQPFAGDAQSRQSRDDALMIRRFLPPHEQSDGASLGFVSLIELRPLAVSCVKVRRARSFAGHPVFVGATVLTRAPAVPGSEPFPAALRTTPPPTRTVQSGTGQWAWFEFSGEARECRVECTIT